MMRQTLLLFLLLFLALPAQAEKVCRVVDGDTFELCDGKTRIRMHGIDTPERGEPFYKVAKYKLDSILSGSGYQVELSNCRQEDRWGRTTCQVWVKGRDVSAKMVESGMAYDWPKFSKAAYSDEQARAKTQRIGIWSK